MLLSKVRHTYQDAITRWLNRRIPSTNAPELTQRSIFIFPSGFGLVFIITALCLFVLGTNYQNNLILLLCYFMLAVMLLHLFISYRNFSKLAPRIVQVSPVFAGKPAVVHLVLISSPTSLSVPEGLIRLRFYTDKQQTEVDIQGTQGKANLMLPTHHRGQYRLPRISLRSDYPLGLIRCWTHLDFAHDYVVYPAPINAPIELHNSNASEGNASNDNQGTEDYHGLHPYRPGEPLHRVAWKRVAKGGDWVTKEFTDSAGEHGWLILPPASSKQREQLIGELCWQIIRLTEKGRSYGLNTGQHVIDINQGPAHMHACLTALAVLK